MPKRVCIIGAGPSGLVAAKTLLHNAPRGAFVVTVYEARDRLGGLWPLRRDDPNQGGVHPLMVANQSRHTVQFSDLAWPSSDPELPPAWMVGRYLDRYARRYGLGDALKFKRRVRGAERLDDGGGWSVTTVAEGGSEEETTVFDYLLVASGFFGEPAMPTGLLPKDVPYCHSSDYRTLEGLLDDRAGSRRGGKILVVGGQMSGVEVAATIATHISSLAHSPMPSPWLSPEKYSVHHVVQRPIWVFPLFTTPRPTQTAAPFVPLDLPSYNLANRPRPLTNTQGHISEDAARATHSIYEAVLRTDQSEYHQALAVTDAHRSQPPYLAVSDHYLDLVRSGLIAVTTGKLASITDSTATVTPGNTRIEDVAAVVFATGYEPSSRLAFLPAAVLAALDHVEDEHDLPLGLAFHDTHHPAVPGLGFVGFYRSPYWGVMEMQARFLAALWSGQPQIQETASLSTDYALSLRADPRASQFPMGDYAWLMEQFSSALGVPIALPSEPATPSLPHNSKPMDILTPARYVSRLAGDDARAEAEASRTSTQATAIAGLTTPKFVARAVFRSLLGAWKLSRRITSRSPHQPSGTFVGTARFLLRSGTTDGLQCVAGSGELVAEKPAGLEYLYIEEGEFAAESGLRFAATRRYVWRYDQERDALSVWFVRPEENRRVDYLFHELEFAAPAGEHGSEATGWRATAGHPCEEDYYGVEYEFRFRGVNLVDWWIEYSVKGPKKDYTLLGEYRRP